MNSSTPPAAPNTNARGPQIIEALKALTANMEARTEMLDHQSRVLRIRYLALIDKGFTEAQASYLCTQDWSNAL